MSYRIKWFSVDECRRIAWDAEDYGFIVATDELYDRYKTRRGSFAKRGGFGMNIASKLLMRGMAVKDILCLLKEKGGYEK